MSCSVQRVCEASGESSEAVKKVTITSARLCKVEDLSECTTLDKVDLSKNEITDAEGLRKCTSITWVNLSHNLLQSMEFISKLRRLTVLNLGYNNISDTSAVSNLKSLKALILNNNKIAHVAGLDQLIHLNTLVLSHNQLEEIEVGTLSALVKLQLSHNALKSFPDIRFNMELKSLLLNENRIGRIPDDYIGDNSKLEIVEIGNNSFKKLKHIKALSSLKSVVRLNVVGNGFCGKHDYVQKVRCMFPMLRILNAQPIHKLLSSSDSRTKQPVNSVKRKFSESDDDAAEPSDYPKTYENESSSKNNKLHTETKMQKNEVTDEAAVSDIRKKKHKHSEQSEQILKQSEVFAEGTEIDSSKKKREHPMSKYPEDMAAELIVPGSHKAKHKNAKPSDELDKDHDVASASAIITKKLDKKNRKKGVPAVDNRNSGVVKVIEVRKSKKPKVDCNEINLSEPVIGSGIGVGW